ncbi:condensation protein [Streptomyces sp. NPDC058671]|uniref:condensation protein n=1 Tax=Streptomyces sp. NPDC058671 TaxID=3346590 RepID=UPI0036644F26
MSRHCLNDDEPESVHIEVHLPGRLDPVRLRTAFQQALLTHPRVLAREVPGRRHRRSFAWELTGRPDTDPVNFAGRGPDALAQARARALAECPPLTESPPMRLDVVRTDTGPDTGTVLLLTTHHTALDAPSGLRVLATTAEQYGGTAALPVPGRVRPGRSGPASSETGRTLRGRPVRVAPDSRPGPVRARAVGNGMVQADLPVPRRAAPNGDLPSWTVNDQLLVATSLMVGRWNVSRGRPGGPVRITMPVDDRPRGTEMPMGNGTRLVEVAMTSDDPHDAELLLRERPAPEAVARLLCATARRTRALKSADGAPMGAGASLLTAPLLPVGVRGVLTRGARRAAASWTSTALVTNIGRVPYALDFGDAGRATAVWFSAPARMPRGLSVAAASTGGRLHVTLRWSRTLLGDAAGAELADLFAESLATTSLSEAGDAPAGDASTRVASVGVAPTGVASAGVASVGVASTGAASAEDAPAGVASPGVAPPAVAPAEDAPAGVASARGRGGCPDGPDHPGTPRPHTTPTGTRTAQDNHKRPS